MNIAYEMFDSHRQPGSVIGGETQPRIARCGKQQIVEGQADAEADRIRHEAQARDPEFYAFLQKLKAYQQMLGESKDVLLLSSRHPLFDLLLNPPKPTAPPRPAPGGGM